MKPVSLLACAIMSTAAGTALAADLLPLKQGIYVPADRACKGASNADIVNYRGGRSAIGTSQAECTIKRLTSRGKVYTITDQCKDIRSGDVIEGGPTVVTIGSPTTLTMGGTAYRHCGTKVRF